MKLPKTPLVLEAVLDRPGNTDADRSVALDTLATSPKLDHITQLLEMLRKLATDAGLARLLPFQTPDELKKPRPQIAYLRRWAGLAACLFCFVGQSAEVREAELERRFTKNVKPFVETYCLSCHDKETAKADFDISPYATMAAVARDFGHWEIVLERLQAGEMPPDKAKKHPLPGERKEVMAWIQAFRKFEAAKNAGDPGPVLARRLSNAEYDNTIRDLTGADIRPTREFPVDPANQAGFDNTGESLTMSPALLKKYLQAAREVSEHLLLKQDGLGFAPHPVITDTDRDKYGVLRIVDFYKRQPTDYAEYFAAAWRFKYRAALGNPKATLADIAAESRVSAKYLNTVWTTLHQKEEVGPIAKLQTMWSALPSPKRGPEPPEVRAGCAAMRDFVVNLREKIKPDVKNLSAPGLNPSAQALVLWKNREWASNRRKYDPALLQAEGMAFDEPEPSGPPPKRRIASRKKTADANLTVPADPAKRAPYEAAFARFAATFPDAFYVSERARAFMDPEEEKANGNAGRLLSAGFHSMTGYFRDDGPLHAMILDEKGQLELDRLWDEFDLISAVPQRMHKSTLWFERTDSRFLSEAEFDFARAEDKDSISEAKVKKLAELYYAKSKRTGASTNALAAIREHFERVWTDINRVERAATLAEPRHLAALQDFAERAYRRSLTPGERDSLGGFYHRLRTQDGSSHEEAIRDSLASILMSPNFLYRVDLATDGKRIRPLSDFELASRLSYFLWSSMPDQELLASAAANDLHKPRVLAAQARRMLKDEKARGIATEFLANWLDFRRFEEWNAVDRERFPQFDSELRQAMFEEPIRFFLDTVRENRSALDFVHGNHTFVNPVLARHYGMPDPKGGSNNWVRIGNARDYKRGGLLPMAVFLTKNAPGLRTSPVKRGYWVVRRVLGERIPPPPPTVPELPNDEAKLGNLTLRETLAQHRDNKACAGCHSRFDSYGLVFEDFGPIGERRTKDFGGKSVDTRAIFTDGSEAAGVDGLRQHIKERREADFLDTLCRQLLAYGLGRTLILSDDSTIREMRAKLTANSFRFNTLVESVVTSPQFLNKRGQETLAKN